MFAFVPMKLASRWIATAAVLVSISGFGVRPAYAQAPAAYRAPQLPTFSCAGNEPFWNLRIANEDAVLGGVDAADRAFRGELTWLEHSGIYAWSGRAEDVRSDELEALIDEHQCRDTMAGEIFPYRVRISLPGSKKAEGCCRTEASAARPAPVASGAGVSASPIGGSAVVPLPVEPTRQAARPASSAAAAPAAGTGKTGAPIAPTRPSRTAAAEVVPVPEAPAPPAPEPAPVLAAEAIPDAVTPQANDLPPGEAAIEGKAPDDWARLLGELLPAIDVCLGRVDDSGAVVTKAWPVSDEMIGVRIVDRDGRRWDCFAPSTAHTVARLEPVDKDAPSLPGEGSPLFTRAGGRPPKGECLRTEVISDETGRRVGWLSYKIC
jgi:uncharacterized membrane protein